MDFTNYYFISESILDDIRRAFTSNILKKRVVGVNADKLKYLSKVDEKSYDKVSDTLKREIVSTIRTTEEYNQKLEKARKVSPVLLKKRLRKDLGDIYVKNVYTGELDDKGEKLDNFVNVLAITVYELNNGGKIVLFTTEDASGYINRFIGIDKTKTNDFFVSKIGTTFQQFSADALAKTKNQPLVKASSFIDDDFYQVLKPKKRAAPLSIDTTTTKNETDLGIVDISIDEYNMLERFWGDGKKSSTLAKEPYHFDRVFKRDRFYNNLGSGYKYYSGNKSVYLLDLKDNVNGLLIFEGKDSYVWANGIGMLEVWRTKPGGSKIRWIKGDINELQ
jgi:hypothetical protein